LGTPRANLQIPKISFNLPVFIGLQRGRSHESRESIGFRVFPRSHREICPAAVTLKHGLYPLSLFTLRSFEQKDSVGHHRQM
jgi:hypothetical protein